MSAALARMDRAANRYAGCNGAPRAPVAQRRRRRRCSGYSLVELLVALAIGAAVSLAVVQLYAVQRQAYAHAAARAQMDDAARMALDLIAAQVRMAGFPRDLLTGGSAPTGPAPAILSCHAGRPAGEFARPACSPDARGSDGIQLSYADHGVATWSGSNALPTDCLGQGLAPGLWVAARFFARPSGSTGEPELYCEGSGAPGTAQPVVQGVETLRLTYWLAGAATAVPQFDPAASARVRAVSICMVIRGDAVAAPQAYADCDGQWRPAGADRRQRRSYRLMLATRNAGAPS